jgi:hypothetical protein
MRRNTSDTAAQRPPANRAHGSQLELTAYTLDRTPLPLTCAPSARQWMDATDQRYAYRCLPLLIANQAGWFVLNRQGFDVLWDGSRGLSGVRIRPIARNGPPPAVTSHFGEGIITFHMPYLFRTSPGYNLLVRGPSNWPKDGVQALEGLVEADWTSATFTMNWKITRAKRWLRFEAGEPVCMIVPQRRGELEAFEPRIAGIGTVPELNEQFRQWSASRAQFLADLRLLKPEAVERKWQKHYFQGRSPGSGAGRPGSQHQTVLRLRPFATEGGQRKRQPKGAQTSSTMS